MANTNKSSLDVLPKISVQETTYEKIRELILTGGIEPGKTVPVQSLSDLFGVSAMPVREALRRLAAEGALTVIGGRSVGIPRLTVDRLEDLRRVRIELETTATNWAIRSITADNIAELTHATAMMDLAIEQGSRVGYVTANHNFHFAIYRATGSETLVSLIQTLWMQIGPYFSLLDHSGNWRLANAQHRAICDALTKKDIRSARQALQDDINGGLGVLKDILIEKRKSERKSTVLKTTSKHATLSLGGAGVTEGPRQQDPASDGSSHRSKAGTR